MPRTRARKPRGTLEAPVFPAEDPNSSKHASESSCKHEEWSQLIAVRVEIRQEGAVVRTGVVDDAMPNSSALWIAADGVDRRQMFEVSRGHEVWVASQGT